MRSGCPSRGTTLNKLKMASYPHPNPAVPPAVYLSTAPLPFTGGATFDARNPADAPVVAVPPPPSGRAPAGMSTHVRFTDTTMTTSEADHAQAAADLAQLQSMRGTRVAVERHVTDAAERAAALKTIKEQAARLVMREPSAGPPPPPPPPPTPHATPPRSGAGRALALGPSRIKEARAHALEAHAAAARADIHVEALTALTSALARVLREPPATPADT